METHRQEGRAEHVRWNSYTCCTRIGPEPNRHVALSNVRTESIRYRHVLIIFIAVLLAASLVADALLVAQQRRDLLAQAEGYAERELRLVGAWLASTLARDEPSSLKNAVIRWAASDPSIVEITAIFAGETLLRYRRRDPADYTIEARQSHRLADGRIAELALIRDVTRLEATIESMRIRLVGASIIFIALLGTFLWVTVRRMALLPMSRYETELQTHRYRLERLVQERTQELSLANRQLQHEVVERRQAEGDLRRSTERLSVLREIDQAILTARSLPEIAEAALHNIGGLIPCKRASIVTFDLAHGEAAVLAVHANEPSHLHRGQRFEFHAQAVPEALREGRPFMVTDIAALETLSPMERLLAEEEVKAYAMLPLITRGELLGVLYLASGESGRCGEDVLEVARELADILAVAIQQIRLTEQVQHHAEELEEQVTRRTHELKQAQSELEALTYSISHDLRGHLWTVQGFADYLREHYRDQLDEEARDYLASIDEAAHAMTVLVQDLLTYSHLNRGELWPAPVDLERIVSRVRERLSDKIRATGARVETIPPLGEAAAHQATLEQVIGQLIDNAITYVPPTRSPEVTVRSESCDGRIRLWIEDNGVGIPENQRERIFGVFQRLHTEEAYPGTGIGLAIVQRGMARIGGTVGVESTPGTGSRFWIELPAVVPPEATA